MLFKILFPKNRYLAMQIITLFSNKRNQKHFFIFFVWTRVPGISRGKPQVLSRIPGQRKWPGNGFTRRGCMGKSEFSLITPEPSFFVSIWGPKELCKVWRRLVETPGCALHLKFVWKFVWEYPTFYIFLHRFSAFANFQIR